MIDRWLVGAETWKIVVLGIGISLVLVFVMIILPLAFACLIADWLS